MTNILINKYYPETRAVDLDDSLLQTPSGKEYLVSEFTDITVALFEKALKVRRALIAKQTGKNPDEEVVLSEVIAIFVFRKKMYLIVNKLIFLMK